MLIVKWNKYRNLDDIRRCENCLIINEKNNFKYCSQCKICCYCSKTCQIEHWKKDHKFRCNIEINKLQSKERQEYRNLYNVLMIKHYENNIIKNNSIIFSSNHKYWKVVDDPEDIENIYILISTTKETFIEYCNEKSLLYENYIDKFNLILYGYNFILNL